jgi:uncharacterized membrane protein YbhN (UPF0104 family)
MAATAVMQFLHRYKAWLTACLTLTIFVGALWVLRDMLAHLRWSDVLDELGRASNKKITYAALCTVASFIALGFHDGLALKIIGRKLSAWRIASTSFISYGIGHSVGLSSLAAGSVRLRLYTAYGLAPVEIGAVIALCSITFTLGVFFLVGLSLIMKAGVAAAILHLPHDTARWLGLLILLCVGGYMGFTAGHDKSPVTIRGTTMQLPPLHLGLAQLLVSCGELIFAAATLYFLLPPQLHLSFPSFVGLYVLALTAGVVSNVPGGLGVFEGILLIMFPNVPRDKLLGAVLLYRVLYYVVPFMLSLPLLLWSEWGAQRESAKTRREDAAEREAGKVIPIASRKAG